MHLLVPVIGIQTQAVWNSLAKMHQRKLGFDTEIVEYKYYAASSRLNPKHQHVKIENISGSNCHKYLVI